MKILTRRRVSSTDAPVLLSLKLTGCVGFPQVVEGCEEKDSTWSGSELALDGAESGGLVFKGWNSLSIGLSLPWPAGLGDDNLLVLVRKDSRESWDHVRQELSRIGSDICSVKEGVAIDSAVIGGIAKGRVISGSDQGIDGNNLSRISSSLQKSSSGADGSNDG